MRGRIHCHTVHEDAVIAADTQSDHADAADSEGQRLLWRHCTMRTKDFARPKKCTECVYVCAAGGHLK